MMDDDRQLDAMIRALREDVEILSAFSETIARRENLWASLGPRAASYVKAWELLGKNFIRPTLNSLKKGLADVERIQQRLRPQTQHPRAQ
jgi:hypothetical protein